VKIRRSLSRNIPTEILENQLDLGVVSHKPSDPSLGSLQIHSDVMSLIVYPEHRLANVKEIPIRELGVESFIAHNVPSPLCGSWCMMYLKRTE
jgi:DNA-binding transcriptional LysR family regulator